MNLIHNSINIAETKDLETLKNQVKACIYVKLQERDMDGFFGDFCRWVFILGEGGSFYQFETGGAEKDWEIMKACFVNAGNLDTIVNYKWAVYRENEGWRCVSGRESGIEYLWEFFEPEIQAFTDVVSDILQRRYEGEKQSKQSNRNREIWLHLLSRFEDWDQVIAKVNELRENNVK